MANKDFLIPGFGMVGETGEQDYLISGHGIIGETGTPAIPEPEPDPQGMISLLRHGTFWVDGEKQRMWWAR